MARTNGHRIARPAALSALGAWGAGLSDAYLTCRDMGHTWRPFTAQWVPDDNCYTRTLRCGRCQTERHQDIGPDGLVLAGHYSYAEGYTAPAGTGRLDSAGRGQLRLESVLRLIGKDER
jgi:hypothetical protein